MTIMALPLKNKVFAITGGASGIGLATAKNLFSKGATVCLADVDPEALANAESYFLSSSSSSSSSSTSQALTPTQNGTTPQPQPQSFSVTRVDVAKRAQVDAWIDGVVARFGRLDGAANIAGIIGRGHGRDAVVDLDDEEWDRILAVNLTGMMYCLRAELRKVVDKGSIVNISSIHGTKGEAYHPHTLVLILRRHGDKTKEEKGKRKKKRKRKRQI